MKIADSNDSSLSIIEDTLNWDVNVSRSNTFNPGSLLALSNPAASKFGSILEKERQVQDRENRGVSLKAPGPMSISGRTSSITPEDVPTANKSGVVAFGYQLTHFWLP